MYLPKEPQANTRFFHWTEILHAQGTLVETNVFLKKILFHFHLLEIFCENLLTLLIISTADVVHACI